MQLLKQNLVYIFLLFPLIFSCQSGEKNGASTDSPFQQPINPNGDSELALLMRAMFDEAETIKTQIAEGKPVSLNLDYQDILTAEATEPEKAGSDEYHAFAKGYLQTIQSLRNASNEEREAHFNAMVGNCMACHQALCPGPVVKIKKLL